MEEKKLRDLDFNDLGKHAVFTASDGDRQSGPLTRISFSTGFRDERTVMFQVGGVSLSSREDGIDWLIQLSEPGQDS